jgi:predicted PurR-regulated permease PerM
MTKERAIYIALILGIMALVIFIAERLWTFGQTLSGIVSTLLGAWLLSLVMRPFIVYLRSGLVPAFVIRWVRTRYGEQQAQRVAAWRLPFGVAVAMVYSLAVVFVFGLATVGVATFIPQLTDFFNRLPDMAARVPGLLIQASVAVAERFGMDATGVTQFVASQNISGSVAQIMGSVAGQAVAIATGTANLVTQLVLMLILSLYITIEDRLLMRQFYALLPASRHAGVRAVSDAIMRAFDGYLKGFILASLIRGLATIIIFGLFGVNFGIVVAIVYGLLSIIPLIGSPVAIAIAGLVALLGRPDAVLPIILILFIFDQIVAYVIMPRIMSDTVGVPGLIGLLAISVGVQLFGFWGLIYAVPIMGAIYTLVFDYYLPRRRKAAGLPELDPELQEVVRPGRGLRFPSRPGKPKVEAGKVAPAGTDPNPSTQSAPPAGG